MDQSDHISLLLAAHLILMQFSNRRRSIRSFIQHTRLYKCAKKNNKTIKILFLIQYKISKPERESESESEDEDDAFGPSTARKDNVNWTDVKDVTRES